MKNNLFVPYSVYKTTPKCDGTGCHIYARFCSPTFASCHRLRKSGETKGSARGDASCFAGHWPPRRLLAFRSACSHLNTVINVSLSVCVLTLNISIPGKNVWLVFRCAPRWPLFRKISFVVFFVFLFFFLSESRQSLKLKPISRCKCDKVGGAGYLFALCAHFH